MNADVEKQLYTIVVDFKKLEREDEELAFCIRDGYHRLVPFLEKATLAFVNAHLTSQVWIFSIFSLLVVGSDNGGERFPLLHQSG